MSRDWSDYFFWILGGIAILLVIFSAALTIFAIADSHGEFEYTTASGETGVATSCYLSFGRGHCYTNDGTMVTVESYRKIGGEE